MTKNSDKHCAQKNQTNLKQVAEKALADNEEKMTGSVWSPTNGWYMKTTAVVLISLVIVFFALNMVLESYMREIPREITPWR